jgi:glycogen debranching enzyme
MTPMPEPWTSSASAPLDGGVVTLVEGSAFCISFPSGDMLGDHAHGLFFRDTRFVSDLRLRINGRWPEPLTAHTLEPFSAHFVAQAAPDPGRADSSLVVSRSRYVGRGMREDFVVRNYRSEAAFCGLDLEIDCDFADLFEVKEGRVQKAGSLSVEQHDGALMFVYARGNFRRALRVDFSQPALLGGGASYEVLVPPGGEWKLCVQFTPFIDGHEITPRYRCGYAVDRAAPSTRLEEWRQHLVARSTEDLAALRLFDPEWPDRTVVAAGAPWFMTVFGRDSLITSWMSMIVDSELALGTLQTLARLQGTEVNPITEEEPGRILHEMRFGETARLSLGGGSIYYGSVDATPLFVMLLGELDRWGNHPERIADLLPAADRALAWIDEFGDRDGDGYVEYQRTSDHGLENQGWKDSWDAVHFADGTLAVPPVALCEVQAYVYGALLARASLATSTGDHEQAAALTTRAAGLKARFNRDFWIEERGWFALGLDRDKRPIDAQASNMGHCLWTGIVDEDKAPRVAARLLDDDMFSGWGVRTLGARMGRFNPVSYHNGSVWPHDNGLCVAGLMRYGLVEEAHRVMCGIIEAGVYFGNRLPELFGGFARAEFGFPVAYPTSCSPQAWAAGVPLLFLRSLLRLEPRPGRVHLAPALPEWLNGFGLDGIPVAGGKLSVVLANGELTSCTAPDGVEIVRAPLHGANGEVHS